MTKKLFFTVVALWASSMLIKAQHEQPFIPNPDDTQCRQWVDNTLSRMKLKDKVGQLIVYTIDPFDDDKTKKLARDVIKKYKIGGVLFSDGTLEGQANLTNYIQSLSPIPVMITLDGEWGLAMRLENTPDFPRNAALGCIEDNNLIEAYGKEVARELTELGIHVNFAPVADINLSPNNPVIHNRSFGEKPGKVAGKVIAYSKGLESGGVLSVSKHFPGHGDTETDSHVSAPILPFSRARLDSVELYPFKEAVQAGLGGIMVGHLKVPELEPDRSIVSSLSPNIINGLLKEEFGFKGMVFTDALEMKGVSSIPDLNVKALKAGNDMILVSRHIDEAQRSILEAVKRGELTEQEIDEKCRKVLTYKYMMGLNNRPQPINVNTLSERINTPEAQNLVTKLRTSAVTVLGNYGHVLPLKHVIGGIAVLSIGEEGADQEFFDAMSKYAPVERFQITKETSDDLRTLIGLELRNYRRVVVSITEKDNDIKEYQKFFNTLDLPAPAVVYTFFTSYRAMAPVIPALKRSSAVVLAHSAQSDVQRHVADVLFAKAPANGKLSMSIGELFRAGDGVEITTDMQPGVVPEDQGMKSYILDKGIDSIVNRALRAGAFPGCQVLVLKDGKPVYDKSFGTHSDKDMTPVRPTDMFDIASLSKTSGTLLAIMKLYDEERLLLTDKASKYLPFLQKTDKKDITIKELLFHESGLHPNVRFYRETIDDNSVHGPFTQGFIDEWHYTQMGYYTYACSDFKFKKGLISDHRTPTHTLEITDNMWLNNSFKNTMMQIIAKSELDKKRYVYSSVGFILLQQIAETITGMPMDQYLDNTFYAPMGLSRTKYLPLRYYGKEEIMPTAANDHFRRQDILGYVHDETTACLGGVSGSAGLFSTAHEIGQIHQMLLNGGELKGKRYLSEKTCRLFTTEKSTISRRGLGFDKPDMSDPVANPCAPSTPVQVYGHTGFTGTCTWVDPRNNFVYVFLSNRICPNVWNDKLSTMKIRHEIQELIYKSME